MTAPLLESNPRTLPNDESVIAHESSLVLARHVMKGENLKLQVVDSEHQEEILLPAAVVTLLLGMLRMKAKGLGLALMPLHSELSTRQAADLLHVSRPYLVKLLESGDIPYHKVGKHRRVRREDVMAYKHAIDRRREAILDELVAESQELGLYD